MDQPIVSRLTLLMLSLMVLGLHVVLLRSAPIAFSHTAVVTPALSFQTRTLTAEHQPEAKPASPKPLRQPLQKAKPKPLTNPVTPPAAPAMPLTPAAPAADAPAGAEAGTRMAMASAADTPELPNSIAVDTKLSDTPAKPSPAVTAPLEAASAPANAAPLNPTPVQPAVSQVDSNALPDSVKLLYEVQTNKFPYNLNAELVWTLKDGHYFASLRVGAFGQYRVQTSRGVTGPGGLLPARFSDKYRSEVAAHFNWPQGKVTFSANTPEVALQPGAQDRMSMLIQLTAIVAGAPERYAPGTKLTLQTVGPRNADIWVFTVGDTETLSLPGAAVGNVEGLKLTRMPRQMYDQQMELWLAPSMHFLPVRMRLTEANGDFVDQLWLRSEAAELP